MINVGQVVAAVAGGALLTIAIMHVIEVYVIQHRREAERNEQDERAWKIETARQITLEGVETFRRRAARGHQLHVTEDSEADGDDQPYGAVEARSKAHLRLFIGGGVAVLAALGAAIRGLIRAQHSQFVSAAATASAVTLLTLTPWSTAEDNPEPPAPVPTASAETTPSPSRGRPEAQPTHTTGPITLSSTRSATPVLPRPSATSEEDVISRPPGAGPSPAAAANTAGPVSVGAGSRPRRGRSTSPAPRSTSRGTDQPVSPPGRARQR